MRHAVFLPIFDALAEARAVADLSAQAEEAGWDGVFVWDHVRYRPPVVAVGDPWIALAAAAMATERVLLGPMVTPLPRRRPVKVARESVALDRLSGGRLVLGVGIASDRSEELSRTGEQLSDRVRGAMLDEALDIVTAAWTGEPVRHSGEHYVVDGITFLPRPVQEPGIPIWVAVRHGNTKPLARAARYHGVFPIEVGHPDNLATLVADVQARRTDPGEPYDVIIDGQPGTDPRPFAAAGATWWLTTFPWDAIDLPSITSIVREGPSR